MSKLAGNQPEASLQVCYCCSGKLFTACCEPYILGLELPVTPEALMRSRYSAYATHQADYLLETTAAATRKFHKKSDILDWAVQNQWIKLEVIEAKGPIVEFKAFYLDRKMKMQIHYERSAFINENGRWFYLDYK